MFERVACRCICVAWFGFLLLLVQLAGIHKYIDEELNRDITIVIFFLLVSMWSFPKFTSNFVSRLSGACYIVYIIFFSIYFTRVYQKLPETGKWRELSQKIREIYGHCILFTMLAFQFLLFTNVHFVLEFVQKIEAEMNNKTMKSKKKDISIA